MYIAAAATAAPIQQLPAVNGKPAPPVHQPVGTQHAVAVVFLDGVERHAVCGTDIRSWTLFSAVTFNPGHPAACQRCAQLVTSARRAAGAIVPRTTQLSPGHPTARD
jgi:hypothetical protein